MKKVLLTGANGYIGKRLMAILIQRGLKVVCTVRDKRRFTPTESFRKHIEVIELDLLDKDIDQKIPKDIDGAYYLVHSMSTSEDYEKIEQASANNFRTAIEKTQVQHVIYLGGIINEASLSKHLQSRKNVEEELAKGKYHFTTLRAGIIIGSGSASFEIMRDLVEKLPIMVAPKWIKTRCQPIGVRDIINILSKSLFNPEVYDKDFDVGGPNILTYKEMLKSFAQIRDLRRIILIVPFMTPRLSSYWLYFITSTSYKLARALVDSMNVKVVCRNNEIHKILKTYPVSYEYALKRAFEAVQDNQIISSWKDSMISSNSNFKISDFLNVPEFGCYIDKRSLPIENLYLTLDKIWRIGDKTGWYYANFLWEFRGLIDKLFGGVGLKRGRTHPDIVNVGDTIDFWRVLHADKKEGRLLLYAEMKIPGEAWLEFKVQDMKLIQTATYRPRGVIGIFYWILIYPLHVLVFRNMLKNLVKSK